MQVKRLQDWSASREKTASQACSHPLLFSRLSSTRSEVRRLGALLMSRAILRGAHSSHFTTDLHELPLPFLVAPFVKVILSPQTSGAITSAALQAVDRFLAYGLIPVSSDPEHIAPGTQMAISEIAHATSHCRFEASDPIVDELVLLRILNVMRELVSGQSLLLQGDGTTSLSLADALGNESICEMMETALSMCCQNRLSGEQICA